MNTAKFYEDGKARYKANTFIGGVGATINTPALLATKLGISATRIKIFNITNNNIQCAIIGGSYTIPGNCWLNNNDITYYEDTNGLVANLGDAAFRNANKITYLEFKGIINLTGSYVVRNSSLFVLTLRLPNCLSVGANAFYDEGITKKNFYLPLCTALGANTGQEYVFFYASVSGDIIYANPSLQTSNAGGIEGDLAYAISRNAIVRYVTNFTAPNAIADLTVGTIYNTAIQLNFTPPSSTNAVEYYEYYMNGVYKGSITVNGMYATNLLQNTSYNITVCAIDILGNRSAVSNVINVITTNDSTQDADAVSYMIASSNLSKYSEVNTLYASLKSAGIYSKIFTMYPFLGATQQQHVYNGKNPLDNIGAFRLTFFGTGTFSDLGFQTNGINAYATTNFSASANATVADFGLTVISGTNNTPTSVRSYEMGAYNSGNNVTRLSVRSTNGASPQAITSITGDEVSVAYGDARGILTGSKTSSTSLKAFKNGVLIGSDTVANASATLYSTSILIGAEGSSGGGNGLSNQRIQFAIIHKGLTDSEVIAMHAILDTFENAIGRKTW